METEYGVVKYSFETDNLDMVYVYDICNGMIRASINYGRPYISLLRQSKNGRLYFLKENHRVYLDKLSEICVI